MFMIKRILIERFIFLIASYIIFILIANRITNLDVFQCSIAGKVSSITQNPRNNAQVDIQFENTNEINSLSTIYNNDFTKKNDLIMIGDSIYKPMFSNDYYVFRLMNNKYKLIYKLPSIN